MVQGENTKFYNLNTNWFEYVLFYKLGLIIPFLPLGKALKKISCVAALNGGDGFSDIYGKYLFQARNPYSYIAMKANAPLIMMPQTIGPFKEKDNLEEAQRILKYASKVYVRDNMFIKELDAMGIKYELTKDLSAYMKPEEWNIDIRPNSIGINVSGLAYSNKFLDLAGQFPVYPELIDRLICHFCDKGHTVYLIPHAYNFYEPELT
jgi:polysaccharide pyruvyl transferase WcaK-like protein